MKYRVEWGSNAQNMLAAVWIASTDRRGITAATAWFDMRLAQEPLRMGEARASSVQRIAFYGGLGIEYEVIVDDRLVIVQGVFAIP